MPYGLFTLFADPFNLRISEIFKMVVVFCVQFMFSHFDALLLLIKFPFPIMFKCKITQAFDRSGHTIVNLLIFLSGNKQAIPKERIPMNKLDLIQTLCSTNGLSKREAAKIVSIFFDQMAAALEKGDRVEIRGLCSFHVKDYEGYTGRNPKTGEKVTIAPKKLPFFKCGKGLRERINR
jgi:integration host factor subunit beta